MLTVSDWFFYIAAPKSIDQREGRQVVPPRIAALNVDGGADREVVLRLAANWVYDRLLGRIRGVPAGNRGRCRGRSRGTIPLDSMALASDCLDPAQPEARRYYV